MASPSRTILAASLATATFSAAWRCSRISKDPSSGDGAGTAPPRTRRSSRRRSSRSRSLRMVTSETPNRSARSGTLTRPLSSRRRRTSWWRSRSLLPGIHGPPRRRVPHWVRAKPRLGTVNGDLRSRQWKENKRPLAALLSKPTCFRSPNWPTRLPLNSAWIARRPSRPQVSKLILEVEDLLQQDQPLVRTVTLQADEERRHLGLPAPVDVRPGHGGQRCLQVVGLDVADQEPVVVKEQRVVPPARVGQGPQHLRPDPLMTPAVLVHPVRADAQQETVTPAQ